ncbi:hypothetical protein Tco_0993975 [Tanacetum coccineum]
MILSPGQPIPYSRPYRYHPNGPIHMMNARKRVGPFLVLQLAVGHPVDHSSSDYFYPDDSARDSSSDSSSEASSDFHSDASFDSSSGHSLSDHSSPDLLGTSAGPSRKRRRSPTTFVPALSPVSGALSPVCADLIPSPKRVKDYGIYDRCREIDECIAYADALRDRGIDARVVVEACNGGNGNGGNGGYGNGGNGGNGNRGNGENRNGGNGHRNGNYGMNYGGTEGVVRLTNWFEKMETVFNISNCPPKYQVKYATCTLQDNALTWWNSHKRTIGVEAEYAMN